MSSRSDIISGYDAEGKRSGLIYTKKCGWIDLGHARPKGASLLFNKIKHELPDVPTHPDNEYFIINYFQEMRKRGLSAGIYKKYRVKKGLSYADKKSVALAIYLDVSHKFEAKQANWLYKHATDSGYSAEDLVSNIIGFYRAVEPLNPYLAICGPTDKETALKIWDKYGAVGSNKNYTTIPYIYPTEDKDLLSSDRVVGPMSIPLPPELNTISPAKRGILFYERKKGVF